VKSKKVDHLPDNEETKIDSNQITKNCQNLNLAPLKTTSGDEMRLAHKGNSLMIF